MDKGSTISENCVNKLWSNFRIMSLNVKLGRRNLPSSTVHNITNIFRDSADISVHKGHSRRPTFNAHDLRALREHCIKNHCIGSGTLPEILVCEHSSPCHPQMQFKDLSCKEETICEHDPAVVPSSLGQSSFKMDRGQVLR